MKQFIELPERNRKPRSSGINVVIDAGVPLHQFTDTLDSYQEHIDFVKFGWCTSLITAHLDEKIASAKRCGVEPYFGGTLFEKALVQGKVDAFREYCQRSGCQWVEISNGTIELSNKEKARWISEFARDFQVLSEVGFKDVQRSLELSPAHWIEYIREDLGAGASKVILEARESGRSGICRADGELRYGLVGEILESGVPSDRLIFEAPTKSLQVYFVEKLGCNVNLANIGIGDIVGVETLRLGLRADTLMLFESA